MIKGTKELASYILGTDVNLGIPTGLSGGLIKEVESPIYATGVGLVLYRISQMNSEDRAFKKVKQNKGEKFNFKNIFMKVKEWFDEL